MEKLSPQFEKLLAELAMIESWDWNYWQQQLNAGWTGMHTTIAASAEPGAAFADHRRAKAPIVRLAVKGYAKQWVPLLVEPQNDCKSRQAHRTMPVKHYGTKAHAPSLSNAGMNSDR